MKFLIKFPTRSRNKQFFETLYKYINNFSDENECRYLISCDYDDVEMNNNNTLDKLNQIKNLKYYFSNRVSKIDAINRDIAKYSKSYDWDIIISAADDMIPQIKNYDKIIAENMNKFFPNLDGGLWFYDGYRKDLNTMSIMGRKRYEEFGYIYHPSYKTWYCDNEYTEIGLTDNKLKFIDQCIIKHELHAHNSNTPFDRLYQENETNELKSYDSNNFEIRKSKGYPR